MRLPWYMLTTNGMLITSPTIPLSISSSKEIIYAESAVPGINYTPLYPNRQGNSKLSFTLPIINRLGLMGNANIMAQFEMLRNSDTPSLMELFKKNVDVSFRSLPQVIYQWGTHLPPLRYWVRQCDFEITTTLTTKAGFSKYTMVNFVLDLDETDSLYQMYRLSRQVQAIVGSVQSLVLSASGRGY